jgi:cyclophilin family peptidyl-prolyl cis-trans isomerase
MIEPLEKRVLFAGAPPTILSCSTDNRGEAWFQVSDQLDPATVNNVSVVVHHAGDDGTVLTSDDVKLEAKVSYIARSKLIYVRAFKLKPDRTYRIVLNGKLITSTDGFRLDGEFNGANVTSGNGVRGGDYIVASVSDRSRRPVARFYTSYGNLDTILFKTNTVQTVANFLHYANEGAWDGTFFHRSIADFVVQGGGFNINYTNNTTGQIHQEDPVVNEPGISNIRGRISMAKLGGDPNSATNQWFFNLSNSNATAPGGPQLDFQNGGFTAFGELTKSGLATIDRIAALATRGSSQSGEFVTLPGIGGGFEDVPFNNAAAYDARGKVVNPEVDLVAVRRVAIVNQSVAAS